jgi:hypothetical protein
MLEWLCVNIFYGFYSFRFADVKKDEDEKRIIKQKYTKVSSGEILLKLKKITRRGSE